MNLKNPHLPEVNLALLDAPPPFTKAQQTFPITSNLVQNDFKTLRNTFKDLLIGTAVSGQSLRNDDDENLALALQHFNAFTAENCMKPVEMQPIEGEFNWQHADRLVELAEDVGASVVGHTLIWHSQTPDWFFQGEGEKPLIREVALRRMRKHIAAVVGRYKGRIGQWDVVNEAISDEEGEFLRPTPWLEAIGDDYIAEAFRAAHEADPDAILIYNDYSNDRDDKRQKTVMLLHSLLEQGVPIHAVGMQCHWQLSNASLEETERAIRAYGSLGLQVMITELDVSVLKFLSHQPYIPTDENAAARLNPYTDGLPNEIADQQAELYRQGFEMFLRHSDVVKRVSFWGITDGGSWLNDFPVLGRTDHPLLFDREGNPKPAFFAIREAGLAHQISIDE